MAGLGWEHLSRHLSSDCVSLGLGQNVHGWALREPGAPGLCPGKTWQPYPFHSLAADARQHHVQHILSVGAVAKAHLVQRRGTEPPPQH